MKLPKLLAAAFALSASCLSLATHAHSGSTAYLQIVANEAQLTVRWDLALRDIDDALQLDRDENGALTWGEVLQNEARLWDYALPKLQAHSADQACSLVGERAMQIADHGDEPYLSLSFVLQCPAIPVALKLDYQMLFDEDASHRGLLSLDWQGRSQSAIFAPDRRSLSFGNSAQAGRQSGVLAQYFKEGLSHVWTGTDHLLFLTGLFLAAALIRRDKTWRATEDLRQTLLQSAKLVTAFTIAHAITLCLAALGTFTLPVRWVESAVAATVLFAGLNNLLPLVSSQRIFALCWVFGLIHGTAIAGALLELGLPASGRVQALLGFNLGVEVAQLALVAVLVPVVFLLRNWRGYVAWVLRPGSAVVAVAGLLWLINRALALGWNLPLGLGG